GDRLALHPHVGNCRAQCLDRKAVAEIDLELVVIRLRHLADQTTTGDDGVATTDCGKHFRTLLHLRTLGADDEEVHHHEDENERQDADENICAACGSLGVCRGDEHGKLLRLND